VLGDFFPIIFCSLIMIEILKSVFSYKFKFKCSLGLVCLLTLSKHVLLTSFEFTDKMKIICFTALTDGSTVINFHAL